MIYLKYMCAGTHEPVMWSSVRSEVITETCAKCGVEVKPHIINELDNTEVCNEVADTPGSALPIVEFTVSDVVGPRTV